MTMFSNPFRRVLIVSLIALSAVGARASDDPWFHERYPLASRDIWGVYHQSSTPVYSTDFAPRYCNRYAYYLMSRRELLAGPAYVAALQVCLRNKGYYCGPIDGINSDLVSEAIA